MVGVEEGGDEAVECVVGEGFAPAAGGVGCGSGAGGQAGGGGGGAGVFGEGSVGGVGVGEAVVHRDGE